MTTTIEWTRDALRDHVELALFLALATGYLIGRLRIGSFKLGPVVGCLLAGLVIGQLGIVLLSLGKTLVVRGYRRLYVEAVIGQIDPNKDHANKCDRPGVADASISFTNLTAYSCTGVYRVLFWNCAGVSAIHSIVNW